MANKRKVGVIVGGSVAIIVTLLTFFGVPAPIISLVSSIGNTVATTLQEAESVTSEPVQKDVDR